MTGNLFLRTSVIMLVIGMSLGIYMGMNEDFTFAPVHAHINLAGGVLMFMAGLFYKNRPRLSSRAIGVHYAIQLLGALLLPLGIYGSISKATWFVPVVSIGSVLTMVAMIYFAVMVFLGTKKSA